MSILDALKTFKQEHKSIDTLAALPQTLIMQMAQKGQIPQTDVPAILSRKAEMAQKEANINALRAQQTQGAAPTIMEQMMAANAQQEVPQEMTDVGIASAGIPERQYAGGGIIAFDEGGEVQRFQYGGMPVFDESGTYTGETTPESSSMFGSFGEAVGDWWNRNTPGSVEYLEKTGQLTPEQAKAAKAKQLAIDAAKKGPVKPATPSAAPIPSGKRPEKPPVSPGGGAPQDDYMTTINQMMKDIQAEREALKGNKQDNANQALLAAGLGMMSGTSPYALSNIGAGGMKGAEHYASLQGQDTKARLGLLKEASDLAQSKGLIGQRAQEAKQRAGLESARTGMMQKRFDMMDKGNRLKAAQIFEQNQAPTLGAALAKQYGKNWQNVPEAQRAYSGARSKFISEALGDSGGILDAGDL